MVTLRLDDSEMRLVEFVGNDRYQEGLKKRKDRMTGLPSSVSSPGLWNDVRSSAGEFAVAKHTGLFWHALADRISKHILVADVGDSFHVKSIDRPDRNLIVRENDPRFGVYFLTYVNLPEVTILGTFPGEQIGSQYWAPHLPSPAFLVKQKVLDAISE